MDQGDELRNELIAIVNAMEEIGPEGDDFLAELYFERKQQLLHRQPERVLPCRSIELPTLWGAFGALAATAATVLMLWLVVGTWYERADRVYPNPFALPLFYYVALIAALAVTVLCIRAERKRLRGSTGRKSRGRRFADAGA